jgi:hypothetical protein
MWQRRAFRVINSETIKSYEKIVRELTYLNSRDVFIYFLNFKHFSIYNTWCSQSIISKRCQWASKIATTTLSNEEDQANIT